MLQASASSETVLGPFQLLGYEVPDLHQQKQFTGVGISHPIVAQPDAFLKAIKRV